MKTITSLKFIAAIVAIIAFGLVLKSCKKVDNNTGLTAKQTEALKAAAIKSIQEKYGNVSAGVVIPVNKAADEYFYRNPEGKMVSMYSNNSKTNGGEINRPPSCAYNCNTTTNPADLYVNYTLAKVERFYGCESSTSTLPTKSTVFVKWTISVPFGLKFLYTDVVPNTFGQIRFTPTSGAPITLTASATAGGSNFVIKPLGATFPCPYNQTYEVTYKFDQVNNTYFSSGTQLDALLSLDNDCSIMGFVNSSNFVSAPTFNQNANLPCNRIDKVYINPFTGPSSCATAAGNYIICLYPSGMTPIDNHQLEYRQVTSSTSLLWNDQTSTPHQGIPTGTATESPIINPYTGVSNLLLMVPSSGKWLVRYRNVSSACPTIVPAYSAWTNNWVTELWTL